MSSYRTTSHWVVNAQRALLFAGLCAPLPGLVYAQEASSAWRYEFYADPMHRGAHIAAAAQESDVGPADGPQVTASIRCWTASGETDARFLITGAGAPLAEETRWRFDRASWQRGRWRIGENGAAVVVPKSIEVDFLNGLRAAGELRLSPGGLPEVRISLRGSSVAIGQVQHHCGL